jgi:hypothetical protein
MELGKVSIPKPDMKWIDALRPYFIDRRIPPFLKSDGTIDAEKTIEYFARAHGVKKVNPDGKLVEWPK